MERELAIIVDVDGTIAEIDHRLNHLHADPKRWNEFYDSAEGDVVIQETVNMVRLIGAEYPILYVTGRPERIREQTLAWIKNKAKLPVANERLLMRPNGDFRPDYEIKREIYEDEIEPRYEIVSVFEDRTSVVKMWRELGLRVFQVADGDF